MADQSSKSFFSLPKRSLNQFDRKSQLISSAAQILMPQKDVFGEILGGLSSTTRSQVKLPTLEERQRNGFLLDEQVRQERDTIIENKWGEQIHTREDSVVPPPRPKLKVRQALANDDELLATPSNPILKQLKQTIAERVQTQVREQENANDQLEKVKQDQMKSRVFSGNYLEMEQQRSKNPIELDYKQLLASNLQEPDVESRYASLPDLEASNPFKFYGDAEPQSRRNRFPKFEKAVKPEISKPDKTKVDVSADKGNQEQTRVETVTLNYSYIKEVPESSQGLEQPLNLQESYKSNAPSAFFKEKIQEQEIITPLNNTKEEQITQKKEINLVPQGNTEWNFQNKIYISRNPVRRVPSEVQSSLIKQSPSTSDSYTIAQHARKTAWKKPSQSKKSVRFNMVAYVLLMNGEHRQENVQDVYRVKKTGSQAKRTNDLSKIWGL